MTTKAGHTVSTNRYDQIRNMKNLILLLPSILLFFFCHSLFGQGMNSNQLDSLVKRALGSTPSVGIAIAIVKDGEIVHAKGYGIKAIDRKEKVDEHTLFAIGSNSKAFTAAALSILVDEGRLTWEDKVIDHVPEFRMYNDYVSANFTIVDLLTHRSGLGLGAGDLMIFPDGADFTIHDVLNSFQYQRPTSAFRTKYDYDNLLYIVAGEVIARVSGMSWPDFIQKEIFEPLGMHHSVPTISRLPENANLALPHASKGEEIRQLTPYEGDLVAPAGGIYASVNDLSKWIIMQLNNGKYGKGLSSELFSEKQQNQMWKPYTSMFFTTKPNLRTNTHFAAYGLGWVIKDEKGKIVIYHTGGIRGMLSKTVLVPELNLGFVVLTNSMPGGLCYTSIAETILDSYLNIEEKDWIKELAHRAKATGMESDSVATAVWKTVNENKSSVIDFKDYTGIYKDNWFGEVEIFMADNKLWFRSRRSPKLLGQMHFYKATTFAIRWEDPEMNADALATYHLNEEGSGVSIRMKGISPNIDFSYDFQDLILQRIK